MASTSRENRSLFTWACMLMTVACGSGESSSVDSPAAAPAASEASPSPEAPVATSDAAESPPPASSSSEGAPVGVELEQPALEPGANDMEPSAETPPAPPAEAGAPVPSSGCGTSAAAASGRFAIDVAGAEREYILALPEDYDATRPYRLVFTWHPGGGSAQGTANNFYGLPQNADGSAIFVSPEGIDEGWANTDGRDIAFLDAMLERFEAELCFDQSRVFSTGFSYGGMMSFAIGCGRADVFRAIAPMSGALFSGCADGDTPIAMLGFHGTEDTVVDIAAGVGARDVIIERNGCQLEPQSAGEDGCLSWPGCADGHSVTWCEFDGGHTPAPQSGQRIWEFFSQF